MTAAQDGVEGAVIRVVNKESRRELRARVVGPGEVEVIR
ncbi:MAG: flagella basal body P-ring formation protein FlgA [Vicinamibacterales bacterium]